MSNTVPAVLRTLALSILTALFASVLAAQDPTNSPEPFGNIVTPISVQDEFAQRRAEAPAAQDCRGTPVEAVFSAVRLEGKLAITAVAWLPERSKERDVCLRRYPDRTVALLWASPGMAEGTAKVRFAKTFWVDLDDPREKEFMNATALNVSTKAGRQSVPVEELPLPSQR